MAKLFPSAEGFLHGGDYNPEQWLDRPDILIQDLQLMKEAGVNVVTLGVFSWSVLEPSRGDYHFEWLSQLMDKLWENGIHTILATPSGARPAWLDEAHPEVLRVNKDGSHNLHGVRHNHCITAPAYRALVREMDTRLARRFAKHPGLLLWHISNEFGGDCYCPLCRERFREFLRQRYDNDIEKLNHAWWTAFWSHRYDRFEQIDPPFNRGETSIMGLNLDWKRFTSWNTTNFMKEEIAALRSEDPDARVTANFMWRYPGLDYHKMAREVDIISWDSYPKWGNQSQTLAETAAETVFDHAMMRSMKPGKPFLLMESAPSLVNWHPYNKLKRPGLHVLTALQALGCGSDSVQYFQWRKGRGSFEQYHGAVVDHLGTSDTRVFRDVAQVGALLPKLEKIAGSAPAPKAAVLYDWENRWALEDAALGSGERKEKEYGETCQLHHRAMLMNGVDADVVGEDGDFSRYRLLAAPMAYLLKPGFADKLRAFVEGGGTLLMTYLSGYVDENTLCWLGGFPGDGLTKLFGCCAEELDTLYPTDKNGLVMGGKAYAVKDYCELMRPQGAEVLASYTDDFYAGTPALTVNRVGEGCAYYLAARTEPGFLNDLYAKLLAGAGIPTEVLPKEVELLKRYSEDTEYRFYLNFSNEAQTVVLPGGYTKLLDRQPAGGELALAPMQYAVLEKLI